MNWMYLIRLECFRMISDAVSPQADVVSVTPGEAYVAAQNPYNMATLTQEVINGVDRRKYFNLNGKIFLKLLDSI